MPSTQTQGDLLKFYIRRSGLTASEMPDKCGVSRQTVYAWLRGLQRVSADKLPTVAEVLALPAADVGMLATAPLVAEVKS